MSIFKRSAATVQTATAPPSPEAGAQAGQPDRPAMPRPPFMPPGGATRTTAAPGVVPPPAAPIYSMQPPQPAQPAPAPRVERDAPRQAQHTAHHGATTGLRVAVQRTRTPASLFNGSLARRVQDVQALSPAAPEAHSRREFDPVAAAQAGLLNLAWKWQEAGSPIRAIHAYLDLLSRYPDTPAADAAVADLVELSNKLVDQGNFHTALAIYDEMEQLQLQSCEEE